MNRMISLRLMLLLAAACSSSEGADVVGAVDGICLISAGEHPDSAPALGCRADFDALAWRPPDASIPGALSSKTIVDQHDHDSLYFLNAVKYPMHYPFCHDTFTLDHRIPYLGDRSEFNSHEYGVPDRRFLLGAVTWYAEPGVWTYEIAPYDRSTPEMIVKAYDIVSKAVFFGPVLYFHPTSDSIESLLPELPPHVKVITTGELFDGVKFLPLNLGEAVGRLRLLDVDELEAEKVFVTPRDIAVLDRVPNDIAVVAAIITAELQTPLSHINVLSQNRGTPNMCLVGAMKDKTLLGFEGQWVRLVVEPFSYSLVEATQQEADDWWEKHKPAAVKVPELDLSVTDLRDAEAITLDDIPAFGGKASHYGVLSLIGEDVPVPKAFGVPVFYYRQFMETNGFDELVEGLLADPAFKEDIAYREESLKELRKKIRAGAVDPDFMAMLLDKLAKEYPDVRMRFRSSTNAEDLDGFTGAGLYDSYSGDPNDPDRPVVDAVRKTWASLWNFRAFEEREWRGISHESVGMAMLVHRAFTDEDANGVALTRNFFDMTDSAFYVNAQEGEASVVKPDPGTTSDQFILYYYEQDLPCTFLAHSNLVPEGQTVLTLSETNRLGTALDAIHRAFFDYYSGHGFYAMDVEWKFNTDPGEPKSRLWVKQARPHAGWSGNAGDGGDGR